jgi:hypothetical protein
MNDKEAQVAAAVALMEKVILGKAGKRPQVQEALARALVVTPAASEHDILLKSAIQIIAARDKITDPAVKVVIWLAERGITPTAGAVSGRLSSQAAKRAGQVSRVKSNAGSIKLGVEQGTQVAAWVAAYIAENEQGPLWSEVAKNFGWAREIRGGIIHRLIKSGVLSATPETRSLRPGAHAASLNAELQPA